MFRIIHPNRWFIWTIALIVMIFIVVWGAVERYAIEQETETAGQNSLLGRETSKLDTTGWKTYRNEEYGFEFKYPVDWSEDTTNTEILLDIYKTSSYTRNLGHGMPLYPSDYSGILVMLRDNEARKPLKEWVQNWNDYFQLGQSIDKAIKISGHDAIQSLAPSIINEEEKSVYVFLANDKILDFSAAYGGNGSGIGDETDPAGQGKLAKERAYSTLDKILSTLTFFEPKR